MSEDPRRELMREEDEGWAALHAQLARLTRADMQRPGYTEDWTVKDMLGHLACWWAETASELERIRAGTYESGKRDVEAMNARFYDAMKDLDLVTIEAELHASRNKSLEELGRLQEVSPAAREWFFESGTCHYREHLPDLERFVEATTANA